MDSQLVSEPAVVAASSSVDEPPAVRVEHLGVQYRARLHARTVRSVLSRAGRSRHGVQVIDALRDVSFDIPRGAVTGVIGRNGSGKSTLLRAIAGILPPTAGRITVRGEVSALLALGVGFNRELSGRDNILIGGLAAGLRIDEVRAAMAEIIEFAELGKFIDYPVRTYSTGMTSRLSFSVASIIKPDILLLDEVLAAGDTKFKEKSVQRIEDLCGQGRTVVLVSHSLGRVTAMANSCVWLHEGQLMGDGEPEDVVKEYMRFCRIRRSKLDEMDELFGLDGDG